MPPAAARPSSRYRSIIVVLILLFVFLGIFALGRLSVDLPPAHAAQRLNIRISAPGLTAPVIEEKLTRQFESALAGIPGVTAMNSVTTTGGATVDLRVDHFRDNDAIQRAILSRLKDAGTSLPASLDPPVMTQVGASTASVIFTLTSRAHDSLGLRDWAEADFAKRLRELAGVATVDIHGGTVREILVMPDQRRLAGYGLSFEDLLQAIRRDPDAEPGLRQSPLKSRSRREPVPTGDLATVAAVPVLLPDGESIRLSEVARLALVHEPAAEAAGVTLTVHKQVQAPLSDVVERVRAHVDWMRANQLIPEGIALQELSGGYDEARKLLGKTAIAFLAGFMLVLTTTHLLWGVFRRTLVLGVIVVVSLQAVVAVMAVTGTALDVLTLGGLAMGTGLIGGCVLLMFEPGVRPAPSPYRDFHQVSVFSIILIAALVPVFLDGGELGVSFRRLVSVFGGAWLLAAWLAWWLVPVFDVRKLPRSGVPWHALIGRALARLRQAYDGLLGQLLRKSALALALTAVVIALLTTVLLVKSREPAVPFGATGQDIVLRVSGEDYTRLVALADEITLSLGQVEALHQVRHTGQASRDELSLHLDEESARQLGVDIAAAGKALAIATTGIPAGSFRDAEHHYNVWMRLPPEDSGSAATGKILLLGELEHRPAVHLRDIASLERAEGPARLVRQNGAFVIEISASAKFGPLPAQAQRRVREAIGKIIIPAGYQVSFGRDVDSAEGYRNLVTLVLSVSAIFVVALLFYRSLRPALVVLFPASVTLVVTGAALRLTGLAFSPAVWLGLILLLGLAAGHAAVLLSFAGAQPPNLPLLRRVRQAARQFFRPLLAMAIVGIMGMLPLMWIDGSVSSLSALVSVLALGLVFSLPVNLLLAPLLFRMLWSKEQIPASPRL